MELSCFIAGVMLSSRKALAETVDRCLLPLRVIFGALFFASIGLHIYPSFLVNELFVLLTLTGLVLVFKIVSTWLVMRVVFFKSWRESLFIGVGLGQVSEFTFVLASKAKRYFSLTSAGVLSRESFFLLIGVTTFSMVASPFLWKCVSYLDREENVHIISSSDQEVLVSFNDIEAQKEL